MTILNFIAALTKLLEQLDPAVLKRLPELVRAFRRPVFSYENLSLSYELDIHDSQGARARLVRKQQVRFLTSEAGVIRDLVWGDGEPNVGYRVAGAKQVHRVREGIAQVVWLGLPSRPAAGERATVRSSRTIVNGLRDAEEYLEVRVERPTKRLRLRAVFPADRRPKNAWLDGVPSRALATHQLRPRLDTAGRTVVEWNGSDVKPEAYRLRWTW